MTPLAWYTLIVTVCACLITAYDKLVAKWRKRRVPEAVLFGIALLGGCAGMYLTMLLIRHKTKHKRFMLGLPAILLVQLLLVVAIR